MDCKKKEQLILKEIHEREDLEHISHCEICKSFFKISEFLYLTFENIRDFEPEEKVFNTIRRRIKLEKFLVPFSLIYIFSFSLFSSFLFLIMKNIIKNLLVKSIPLFSGFEFLIPIILKALLPFLVSLVLNFSLFYLFFVLFSLYIFKKGSTPIKTFRI